MSAPRPVVLASARSLWEELVSRSALPSAFFQTDMPPDPSDQDLERVFYFGESLVDPDTLRVDEVERLDQMLFSCRNGTFVWLHRFDRDPAEEIASIKTASASWKALVEKRKRRYESEIRPVVVLVGGDSTSWREQDFRQFLVALEQCKEQVAFLDIFVMAPRLEPAGREIFHARNVWPLSVSRLLVHLSARSRRNQAKAVYAWRFSEVRHTDPGLLYEQLLPACTDALFERMRSSDDRVTVPEGLRAESRPQPIQRQDVPVKAYWFEFDAVAETRRRTSREEVFRRLSEASEADHGGDRETALANWLNREKSLDQFWKTLHLKPGTSWAAETALRSADKSLAESTGKRADRKLEDLPGEIRALEGRGNDLRTGAEELALAQDWFLRRWYRMAIALSAGSVLGLVFFRAAQVKFASPEMAGLVAAGCIVGALLASTLCYAVEIWRGGLGVEEWRSRHTAFEAALGKLHLHLVDLRNAGAQFASDSANLTLRARLLRLVRRLIEAAVSAFERSPTPALSADGSARKGGSAVRFLARSTAQIGDPSALREEAIRDVVDYLLKSLSGFSRDLEVRWQQNCRRSDTPESGAVDAALLRAGLAEVLASLAGEIDRIAATKDQENPTASLEKLRTKISAIRQDQHPDRSLDLLSIERSDGATLELAQQLFVSAALARDGTLMQDSGVQRLPAAVEGWCPALLVETAQVSLEDNLVAIGLPAVGTSP